MHLITRIADSTGSYSRFTTQAAVSVCVAFFLLSTSSLAQNFADASQASPTQQPQGAAINVNWLYGAYVPRDVTLEPLTSRERETLYLRQTYLTWGIYFKTALFSLGDQAAESPPEWGDGIGGYGKRVASRYGQFAIQNTFSAGGNLLLGYEPRYDRCRCSGGWRRLRHAVVRNFVTYNRSEQQHVPQFALYAGAMGAGMVASTWKPAPSGVWRQGYQSVATQVLYGSFANILGEFAPDIARLLKKGKSKTVP